MIDDQHADEEPVSKSQRKRDAHDIADLGERLATFTDDQLASLPYPDVLEAIRALRKISKGNARKRQLMYIAKLLRRYDLAPVTALVNRYDASTTEHIRAFHRLESWRERLIDGDDTAFEEIAEVYPDFDRQQLRSLVRLAREEAVRRAADEAIPPRQFRRLFQFLKSLAD